MKFDYLIVGSGLSSLMLCEALRKRGKTFMVVSNRSQQASIVASGLYNPVVLKRFNKAWDAEKHLPIASAAYTALETYLDIKIDHKQPIYRVFSSVKEQNNWFLASDNPQLQPFLTPKIISNKNININAPFGFGKVNQTGRVDTNLLLESYSQSLKSRGVFLAETFSYSDLDIKTLIHYKDIVATQLIFAQGFGLKNNPYFKNLPLGGTKGELLLIIAPDLKSEVILKSSIFVIPVGKDHYLVGSTYAWDDSKNTPTAAAKNELLYKLKGLINCSFHIVKHRAGIRPTVVDRRPLIGQHKTYKNLYILNGLGSRGVLIAPSIANELIAFIEEGTPLSKLVDIKRFQA